MSPKFTKSPAKAAAVRPSDDLDHDIRKASRKRRVFSWIVLAMLLLAFVVTSVLQVMPMLSKPAPADKDGAAPAPKSLQQQIVALQGLTKQHPHDVDAVIALGNLQFDAEDYTAAATAYRQALTLDPGNADVRVDYGTCLYYTHQPMEAITQFRKVLDTRPRHVNAHVNLGVVYNSLGQRDKAADEWHTAFELTDDPATKTKIKNLLQTLLAAAN